MMMATKKKSVMRLRPKMPKALKAKRKSKKLAMQEFQLSKEISKEIDGNLRYGRVNEESKTKLLLLGAGNAGKTTVMKQLNIIYGHDSQVVDLEATRKTLTKQVIRVMKDLSAMAGPGPVAELPVDKDDFVEQERSYSEQDFRVPVKQKVEEKSENVRDYTGVPPVIEELLAECDLESLRPTTIQPGETWTRKQKNLLSRVITSKLKQEQQTIERNKAFDLIDALSRSGNQVFSQAELHIILGFTHCFDRSLLQSIYQQNINPIEDVERSTLLVASVVHQREAVELVKRR